MKNKLYRIISPVTLLVVLALDAATVAYAVFAVKKLIQNVSVYSVLFAIIDLFAIVVAVLVSKYVVSQGIVFGDETFEFTAHDENNVFNYDDVEITDTLSKEVKRYIDEGKTLPWVMGGFPSGYEPKAAADFQGYFSGEYTFDQMVDQLKADFVELKK